MFSVLGLLRTEVCFLGVQQWLLFASVSQLTKIACCSSADILWCVSRLSPLVSLAFTETQGNFLD